MALRQSHDNEIDDFVESFSNLSTKNTINNINEGNHEIPALREYQKTIVKEANLIIEKSKQHKLVDEVKKQDFLIYLPTGGGKTRIAIEIAQNEVTGGGKVLFVVNRDTLTTQAYNSFSKSSLLKVGILETLSGNKKKDLQQEETTVLISTIQMLNSKFISKNKKLPEVSMVIIDECHCVHAPTYQSLASEYQSSILIGLTATPFRLNPKEELSSVFSRIVRGPSVSTLIREKVLVPPIVYGETIPCNQKVAESEYSSEQAVKLWNKHAHGLATVVFCTNIKHSKTVSKYFNDNNVKAEHVDGDTSKEERERNIRRLGSGEIDVLCSVGVLCEGFDLPVVSCVILLRPTDSRGLYIQQLGRGLRCHPPPPPQNHTMKNDESVNDLSSEVTDMFSRVQISSKIVTDGLENEQYDEVNVSRRYVRDDEEEEDGDRMPRKNRLIVKTKCVVIDLVGLTAKFGPIMGPPGYNWEEQVMGIEGADVNNDKWNSRNVKTSVDITEKNMKKKSDTIILRRVPIKACPNSLCGAFFHKSVSKCLGCDMTVQNDDALRAERIRVHRTSSLIAPSSLLLSKEARQYQLEIEKQTSKPIPRKKSTNKSSSANKEEPTKNSGSNNENRNTINIVPGIHNDKKAPVNSASTNHHHHEPIFDVKYKKTVIPKKSQKQAILSDIKS